MMRFNVYDDYFEDAVYSQRNSLPPTDEAIAGRSLDRASTPPAQ
jgi:hypothetical protein